MLLLFILKLLLDLEKSYKTSTEKCLFFFCPDSPNVNIFLVIVYFIKIIIHLFERQQDRDLSSTASLSNVSSGSCWARSKLQARKLVWVYRVGGRDPTTGAIACCSPWEEDRLGNRIKTQNFNMRY